MDRNSRKRRSPETTPAVPTEAWLFAQQLLGNPIPNPAAATAEASRQREQLGWLASISTRHEAELRRLQSEEAQARHERELLDFLAAISTEHEAKLRHVLEEEAKTRAAQARWQAFADNANFQEDWDAARHPRGGFSQNLGWFSPIGGAGTAGRAAKRVSPPPAPPSPAKIGPRKVDGMSRLYKGIIKKNQDIARELGEMPPQLVHSSRLAMDLDSARNPAVSVVGEFGDGLRTGGKALVNGGATAIKDTATLGLMPGQLELIGVTREDRDRGYDTAVAISTASGEVLIAVGTGQVSSLLSKGGQVAQTVGGAFVVFDAAGNSVGVVRSALDIKNEGLTLTNGVQLAGSSLGLTANVKALQKLKSAAASIDAPKLLLPKGFDPTKGFATFNDFKAAFGAAEPGHAWHHIVEQTINSGQFAAELLHNPGNLFQLPHGKGSIHAKLSGFYSSKPPFTGGLTVREWLSKKTFMEQFEYGIQKIKELGGAEYLPPEYR